MVYPVEGFVRWYPGSVVILSVSSFAVLVSIEIEVDTRPVVMIGCVVGSTTGTNYIRILVMHYKTYKVTVRKIRVEWS